jgi:charged multivesicular body protein 4A/B
MMAGFMSYFGGRRDSKQSSRDAIVNLRQQLQMVEKKEEYLQKKIDEELRKAKANAVSNKQGAFRFGSWTWILNERCDGLQRQQRR